MHGFLVQKNIQAWKLLFSFWVYSLKSFCKFKACWHTQIMHCKLSCLETKAKLSTVLKKNLLRSPKHNKVWRGKMRGYKQEKYLFDHMNRHSQISFSGHITSFLFKLLIFRTEMLRVLFQTYAYRVLRAVKTWLIHLCSYSFARLYCYGLFFSKLPVFQGSSLIPPLMCLAFAFVSMFPGVYG